jgi:hypothetical protein
MHGTYMQANEDGALMPSGGPWGSISTDSINSPLPNMGFPLPTHVHVVESKNGRGATIGETPCLLLSETARHQHRKDKHKHNDKGKGKAADNDNENCWPSDHWANDVGPALAPFHTSF